MLTLAPKNENATLLVPGNKDETLDFCVSHWIQAAQTAIQERGAFYVALSGGSTPSAIFSKLASDHEGSIDWKKVHLFWSDERSVPPTHEDSNYRMAMDAGFARLPIPEDNIHRIEAEDDVGKGAEEYEQCIKETLNNEPFDLIMLGMGDDGHTASLFPNTTALDETTRLVVANFVPEKDTWRVTMTYPILQVARQTVVYVLGKNKNDMLYRILVKNEPLPSHSIGTNMNKATWIADEDASEKTRSSLSSAP